MSKQHFEKLKVTKISDSGEYSCFCPLHHDENPSLAINVEKGVAYCFAGCFSGRLTELIAQLYCVPRTIAWRMLVEGKVFDFSADETEKKAINYCRIATFDGLKWVEAACSPYLLDRGFVRSTLKFWDIDYSDEIRHIRIPIKSQVGELLAYSYRTVDDLKPKYLHPGLKKSSGILFGEHMFEPFNGIVNLVEGALDCIWLWQNGYRNSLAFLGNPTKSQLEHIFDFGDKFRLCLDNDEAGRISISTIGGVIRNKGLTSWSITIPNDKKDVQDLSSKELREVLK